MTKSPQEVLNELNIQYEIKGDNFIFRCTNPAHEDRKPSCSMDIDQGMYKCWGCGDSGNIYTLYKRLTGNSLDSDYSNLGYSNTGYAPKKRLKRQKGDIKLVEGSELSVFNNKEVMRFLESINIDEDTILDFNISYAKFARYKSKHSDEYTRDGKLFKGTAMVNRILIPIKNEKGELVNIEARSYKGDEPKVLYVKDGVSDLVFNLENCDPEKPLVIVEGIKALCNIRHVYPNVISFFGCAITETKLNMLKENGFTDIILGIDWDTAGFHMAENFDENWEYDFKVATYEEDGENIGDLKTSLILDRINEAQDYGEWLFENMKPEKTDLSEYW